MKGKVLEISFENTYKALQQPTYAVDHADSGNDEFVDPADGKMFALLVATAANQHSVVRFLLERQKALGLTDGEIGNAFVHAAEKGNIGMVQLFLDRSKELRHFLRNAFDMAVTAGQLEMVKVLLNYPSMAGEDAKESVQTLLCSRHSSVAKIGLDMLCTHLTQSEQVDARTTALKNICAQTRLSEGGSQMFGLLLETQPPLGVKILVQSFMTACRSGNAQAAMSVYGKADRNHFQDENLLQMLFSCASQGHLELVRFLVGQTSLKANGILTGEIIIVASGHGHAGIVEFLLRRMEKCEELENTLSEALLVASEAGHPTVVEHLIKAGANVDALLGLVPPRCIQEHCFLCRDPYGTLEHFSMDKLEINALQACLRGLSLSDGRLPKRRRHVHRWTEGDFAEREAVFHLLLSYGADPNVLGGCDDYPIIYAAAHCSVSVLTELINSGADVNLTNSDTSALHVAASRELSANEVLQRLLDAGADITNSEEGAKSLMNEVLNYFFGEVKRDNYLRSGHPDGRFLHADSLEYVFEEGPGAAVETLLSRLPNMRACDKRYELVLQMAALLDRHETVTLLLQRGVDVNAVGYYYGTALQAASRCGHSKTVKLLLGAQANVNILQGRHQTALCAAIVGCHADIVETLIQAGADMSLHFASEQSYANNHGKALQLAVRTRRLDIVKLLLDAGVDVYEDTEGQSYPMLTACDNGDLEIVTALLDAGSPVNVSGKMQSHDGQVEDTSPLHRASAKGHADLVRLLVARGADVKQIVHGINEHTPLDAAASTGQLECVRSLLAAGLNTDIPICGAALLKASRGGHVEVVRELLHCDVSVEVQADAFIQACLGRHYRSIELLIESMAVLDTDRKGYAIAAALEVASSSRDERLWRFLLEYKVMDPEILVHACIAGSLPSVKTALSRMIQVDSEDTRGRRGLHAAAYGLHASVVKELIHYGADVNYDHPLYGSPLVAALEGCLEGRLAKLENTNEYDNLNATSDDASHPSSKELSRKSKQLAQEGVDKQETEPARHRREIRPRLRFRTRPDQVEKDFAECQSILRDLLAGGAKCDIGVGSFGNALHLAAFSGDASLVQLLLDNGADVNAYGGYFGNALFAALEGEHPSIIDLLLARKIYIHTSFNGGLTPLHYACLEEFASAVRSLLENGADPNARDNQNRSAISCALSPQSRGYSRYWRLPRDSSFEETTAGTLLKYGTNIEISEDDLETSATLESRFGQPEPLEILLKYDQAINVTESVLLTVLRRPSVDRAFLEFLLERSAGLDVTESMLKSTRDGNIMEVLLRQQAVCEIHLPILESQGDWRCVELLLEHATQLVPTQAVLIKALEADDSCRTPHCLEDLWKRNLNLKVSDDMLKVTRYSKDMEFLLSRCDPDARISTEVLATVLEGRKKQNAELLRLLFTHEEGLQVPTDLISKSFGVADAVEVMELLLEHDSAITITEEMLLRMFVQVWHPESRKRKMVELMQRFGKTVKVTVDSRAMILKRCDADCQRGMRGLVSSLMI